MSHLKGEHAEEIVARVRAEEKDKKPRPEKSTRRAPEAFSQAKRKDTLTKETKSLSKPQPTRGDGFSSQMVQISSTPSKTSMLTLGLSYLIRATG